MSDRIFADYARYYNLLYRDKDYAGETGFVLNFLTEHKAPLRTLLDLGCGTGRHALEMARRSIAVTGIDLSETMLETGKKSLASLNPATLRAPLPVLLHGNAATARLGQCFDAVTSLFHVMSYQSTEEDALSIMKTAYEHLEPGGIFLFDFWHGPGVLRELPSRRESELKDAATLLTRVAVPELRVNDNIVIVNYTVNITDLKSGQTARLYESHTLRYWFLPELRNLARQAGFTVIGEGGWMRLSPPELSDWNAWMACGK